MTLTGGQYQLDVISCFEHHNRFVSGGRLHHIEPGILDDRGGLPSQEYLILDDEHDGSAARLTLH